MIRVNIIVASPELKQVILKEGQLINFTIENDSQLIDNLHNQFKKLDKYMHTGMDLFDSLSFPFTLGQIYYFLIIKDIISFQALGNANSKFSTSSIKDFNANDEASIALNWFSKNPDMNAINAAADRVSKDYSISDAQIVISIPTMREASVRKQLSNTLPTDRSHSLPKNKDDDNNRKLTKKQPKSTSSIVFKTKFDKQCKQFVQGLYARNNCAYNVTVKKYIINDLFVSVIELNNKIYNKIELVDVQDMIDKDTLQCAAYDDVVAYGQLLEDFNEDIEITVTQDEKSLSISIDVPIEFTLASEKTEEIEILEKNVQDLLFRLKRQALKIVESRSCSALTYEVNKLVRDEVVSTLYKKGIYSLPEVQKICTITEALLSDYQNLPALVDKQIQEIESKNKGIQQIIIDSNSQPNLVLTDGLDEKQQSQIEQQLQEKNLNCQLICGTLRQRLQK